MKLIIILVLVGLVIALIRILNNPEQPSTPRQLEKRESDDDLLEHSTVDDFLDDDH